MLFPLFLSSSLDVVSLDPPSFPPLLSARADYFAFRFPAPETKVRMVEAIHRRNVNGMVRFTSSHFLDFSAT